MVKLTSRTKENAKTSINEQYPGQNNTQARAGLGMKNFPTLKELWDNADEREKKKSVKEIGEGNITIISALGSHNYGRKKSIVGFKNSENPMT